VECVRITFVSSSAGTTSGGIETTVLSLAHELSKRHDVALITGRRVGGVRFRRNGVRVLDLPFLHRFGKPIDFASRCWPSVNPYLLESLSLRTIFSLSATVRKELRKSEVFSTHTKYDSLFFSRLAAKHGTPSVFHVQGSRFGTLFKLLDRTTSYIAVSTSSKLELVRNFGLPIRDVVSPGVSKKLLGLSRDEMDYVLFVARLQRSKGIIEAVRILSLISPDFPGLRLVVIGEGPGYGEMRGEAIRLAVLGKIDFLGALSHEEVWEYYSHAKLLLFPSRSEVYPLVPLEAMAAGCPVVASDISGVAESTGRIPTLVSVDDVKEWIKVVTLLLTDDEARVEQGNLGREWARRRTWDKVALEYEHALSAAVNMSIQVRRGFG